MFPKRLTFIDVETTGTSFRKDRVIEIGLILVEDGKITAEYESLINPDQYVPAQILEMTGITQHELDKAPSFRQVLEDIAEMLVDTVFVAHNAQFDYGFIKSEFRHLDQTYTSKCLCTVKLSRALFPQYKSHNLDSLINRFGIKCDSRHRALSDAKVMVNFVDIIKSQFSPQKIEQVVSTLLRKPSVPVGVSSKILDALPESPGVYIFYSGSGAPLYVGKSVNVKDRVLSHFSAASMSATELSIASQVKDIEVIKTEGELGALLKESELIKKLLPIYNKKLRASQKLFYLVLAKNEQGYKVVKISTKPEGEILGLFKTQKQIKETLAMLSEKHNLCKKLLGIEKSNNCCFAYHLHKCKGACVGEESQDLYNLRFDLAFIPTRIKAWPFTGPIALQEGNDVFVLDNWQVRGVLKIDDVSNYSLGDVKNALFTLPNFDSLLKFSSGLDVEPSIDLDSYKILSSFLFSKKNQKSFRVLG